MKLFLLAVFLVPSLLVAQNAPPVPVRRPYMPPGQVTQSEPLADNYQLTLTVTDKEGAPLEMSIVVASSYFSANFGEQGMTFAGTIALEEGGNMGISYALGWETAFLTNGNTQFKSTSLTGSVHLKLGEDVQIVRTGTRTIKLSVQKLGK